MDVLRATTGGGAFFSPGFVASGLGDTVLAAGGGVGVAAGGGAGSSVSLDPNENEKSNFSEAALNSGEIRI